MMAKTKPIPAVINPWCLVLFTVFGLAATAIALPNFVGAQKKAKLAAIKGNMRTVQIAAESYATDAGGYPNYKEQLLPYLPGGSNTLHGNCGSMPTGTILVNGSYDEWAKELPDDIKLRNFIFYYHVSGGNGIYAIESTDENGNFSPVMGVGGKPLVLCNQ